MRLLGGVTGLLIVCAFSCGPSPEYQGGTIQVVAIPADGAQPADQPVAAYDSPGPTTPIAPQQQPYGQPVAAPPQYSSQPEQPYGQAVAPPQPQQPYAQPVAPPHQDASPPSPHPPTAQPVAPPPSATCNNSCPTARDGICDDTRRGGRDTCEAGSDCDDCGPYRRGAEVDAGCTNTCRHADDDECDDGRSRSDSDLCSRGTDCNDCGR